MTEICLFVTCNFSLTSFDMLKIFRDIDCKTSSSSDRDEQSPEVHSLRIIFSGGASVDSQLDQVLEGQLEEQILDEPVKKFTWKIPKFSKLAKTKHFSWTFSICGGNWRIGIGDITDHLSLFLDVPDAATLPREWKQYAHSSFILVNQINQNNSKNQGGRGEFNATCLGFLRFIPLRELKDCREGYLVNDTLIIKVEFESEPTRELVVRGRKFRWEITTFSTLTAKLAFSPTFEHGGKNWQLMTFPVGNINNKTHLSLYLQLTDFSSFPEEWTINSKFRFHLMNRNNSSRSIVTERQQEFRRGRTNRGSTPMIPFSELRDGTKGFIVNDTLIVEVDFILPEVEPRGEQLLEPTNFTWKIKNFSRLNAAKYYSQIFAIGGCSWRLQIYPEGKDGDVTDRFSVFLEVACSKTQQQGWTRSAEFSVILVDQINGNNSIINRRRTEFNSRDTIRGFSSIISLTELHDRSNGYLVDDTVIIMAEFMLPEDQPEHEPESQPEIESENSLHVDPTDAQLTTDMLDSYFSNLKRLITDAEVSAGTAASSSYGANALAMSKPSLEEAEEAKQSLKECLSDLFKLNMKERLAEALSTLSVAKAGLTANQQRSIRAFWDGFNEFTSDFLAFEQDNAEFELLKVKKDCAVTAMKRSQETHLSLKNLKNELAREAEELERRLQRVNSRREKLTSEWEILLVESEEARSEYEILEKKAVEAEEKKRIAEERM